ncbi:MAG TPA: hypothetical protein V6D48_26400 [Oculatellaceae cyanobacterium]
MNDEQQAEIYSKCDRAFCMDAIAAFLLIGDRAFCMDAIAAFLLIGDRPLIFY